MSNKLYDYLKFIAQIALPAVGVLYVSLAALWGLPKPQEVAGTILAVDTFLGVLLGLQARSYNKDIVFGGEMNVFEKPGDEPNALSFQVEGDPEDFEDKREVRFEVKKKRAKPRQTMGQRGRKVG